MADSSEENRAQIISARTGYPIKAVTEILRAANTLNQEIEEKSHDHPTR